MKNSSGNRRDSQLDPIPSASQLNSKVIREVEMS